MRFFPLVMAALALTAMPSASGQPRSSDAARPAFDSEPEEAAVWTARPGPWGRLEIRSTYLEAPDDLIATVAKPNPVPRWFFPDATEESLRALFQRASLPADLQARLLDPQRRERKDNLTILFPSFEDVEALTPAMRAVIYTELGGFPLNEFQARPIFITSSGLDDWLHESPLRAELREIFRRMIWRRGRALLFSDVQTLLHHARSDAEVPRIFKMLTRVRTLTVELKLPPETDPGPLLDYWSAGNPSSDIVPFLESVIARAGITRIDITHLLPPLARQRLHTFPTLDMPVRVHRLPDCIWTSLNFFNKQAQDYYLDMRLAYDHLLNHYDQVGEPCRFGDVICLLNGSRSVIHACVFVADDIVFTKNGSDLLAPWVLMRLDDVKALYQQNPAWPVQVCRRKPVIRSPGY